MSSLFFGRSIASARLLRDLHAFAAVPYPVLILGPTGSGKTVLARYLHLHSSRADRPFVALSLPTIPEELRHSELSGCRRGAFTGATEDRPGALEAANRGTLFLDEVGLASPGLQHLLLTVLEANQVRRVGEVRERPVDVRFLFATNSNLEGLCATGAFLHELRFRMENLVLTVPGLSARRDEIIPLARHFLKQALGEVGKDFGCRMTPELERLLQAAPWPGNIRQLQGTCRCMAVSVDADRPVDVRDLPDHFLGAHVVQRVSNPCDLGPSSAIGPGGRPGEGDPPTATIRDQLLSVCAASGWNAAAAARALGLGRTSLFKVLKRHGLSLRDHRIPTALRDASPGSPYGPST